MKTLSKPEERNLVKAIERAISYTNKGESPDAALTKVAKEEKLTPPFIQRMVEAFNKSKSVYTMKEASEQDRHKPFELADANTIISNLYTDSTEKEAAAVEPLKTVFSFGLDAMLHAKPMDKVASIEAVTPKATDSDVRETATRLYKQAHVADGVQRKLHNDTLENKYAFDNALEKVAEQVLGMSDSNLRKVAQTVVSGYPGTPSSATARVGTSLSWARRPTP
jgi:hypothetical protein